MIKTFKLKESVKAIQDEIASTNPQTTDELKKLTLAGVANLEKSFENQKPEGGEKGVEGDRLNEIGDQIEELKTIFVNQMTIFVNQMASLEETTALAGKKMLRVKDLARLTGFSLSQIYRLTSGKKIPYYPLNGKTIFFDRDEVDKWLRKTRISTNEELDNEANRYVYLKKRKGGRI